MAIHGDKQSTIAAVSVHSVLARIVINKQSTPGGQNAEYSGQEKVSLGAPLDNCKFLRRQFDI